MSLSIGIFYPSNLGNAFVDQIRRIAIEHEYGLVNGLDTIDQDVSMGVRNFLNVGFKHSSHLEDSDILFISTPDNANASLAYGIYDEFSSWARGQKRPKFFSFLREVEEVVKIHEARIKFLFCYDFLPSDEVVYRSGSFVDFVNFLELPGFWTLALWSPKSGIIQESDRYPLIFSVV